jgi:hypothetical protein
MNLNRDEMLMALKIYPMLNLTCVSILYSFFVTIIMRI